MNNKRRYLIVMILCVLLNEGCYRLASAYNWPVWMDMTGTALAVLVLEPTAGLLVGLVNNFILSAFVYDASSLVYYSISAAAALIVGLGLKKAGKINCSKIPMVMISVIVSSSLLSGMITIWQKWPTCLPDAVAEQQFYYLFLEKGIHASVSCLLAAFLVKVFDILASAVIVFVAYRLLPRNLKYSPDELQKSQT